MKKEYRNVIRTKKMIRTAFMELLEERKDIEHISVNALVERADLSKSTFYYHYEDIYAVVEEMENELLAKFLEVLAQIKKEQATEYGTYVKIIIDFLKENEGIYRKAICNSSSLLFMEKMKSVLAKKIFENNQALCLSKNANVHYLQVRFLTNAFIDTLADYFKGILNVSLDQLGETLLGFIDKLLNHEN